ncbi:MAG: exodeoxyribonuclease VII large subunit [Gammaproteobacteria bacterium]
MDRQVFTISQLNSMARELLEEAFAMLWIEGEISNFSAPSSGHIYFSLKDSTAQVRCAMFQQKHRNVRFPLSNGLKVIVNARVSLYEARGDYQLIVERIEELGDGALQRAFEQLKKKLAAEGLFDIARKRPLPILPKAIGVITSPTGAAIRDILNVLKRRFAGIPIIIYPCLVQGNEAARQIVEAITRANKHLACDVLIIARGGGSLEDLWPFNEEIVARAIFNSGVPIISGVGHEIDFTIADFVADHRAPTPSAAAELVSQDSKEWQNNLSRLKEHLQASLLRHLKSYRERIISLDKQLRLCHPQKLLEKQFQTLDYLEQRLHATIQNTLKNYRQKLVHRGELLNMVSPLHTLDRGYAIVTDKASKHVVYSARDVIEGTILNIRLKEGEIICEVITF